MAIITSSLLIDVFISSSALIVAVYFYIRCVLYNYWKKRGVVYVEPTVPTGNIGRVFRGKMSIGQIYAEAYNTHKSSRYFGMYSFHNPRLVITEPDLIKEVLTREFSHFHDRGMYCNDKVDPLAAHLFFLSGEKWRNLRRKILPAFTSGKLKRMFPVIAECGAKLTENLEPKAQTREVFEIRDLVTRFSIDIVMSVAFGVTSNSMTNPESEFKYWNKKIFEPKPLKTILTVFAPKIMDLFLIPFTDRGVSNFFINVFKDTVTYREENGVTRNDFLDLVMQLMKRGYVDDDNDEKKTRIDATAEKLSLMEGASQAFMFFVAGHESSASTITHCLFELACNQDLQDKAANEISLVNKKFGGFTWDSLQELSFLEQCILETLRKYPILPMLDRMCTQEIDLPTTNLHIEKGVNITIPVLGIQRDPEFYPDPDTFDPERFNPENTAARHPYVFLPFGGGPRFCLGKRLAIDQVKVGLVSVLSKYRVRVSPETTNPLEWVVDDMLMISKYPVFTTIEPR